MINCIYKKDIGMLQIDGHANYAPYGQDIVCAGVTAIWQTLVAYLNAKDDVKSTISAGDVYVIICNDESMAKVMECAAYGIQAIAEHYPENVSFRWG